MNTIKNICLRIKSFWIIALLIVSLGCDREERMLPEATFPSLSNGVVFDDTFAPGSDFGSFGGTAKLTAFDIDFDVSYEGEASMQLKVPDADDPEGNFAGGIIATNSGRTDDLSLIITGGRDLTEFNVLTFWAKSSIPAQFGEVGFGDDFSADQFDFKTVATNVPVNTNWTQYYVPIPDASFLVQEKGLFVFTAGAVEGRGYTVWVDEVRFEYDEQFENGVFSVNSGQTSTREVFVGQTINTSDVVVNPVGTYLLPNDGTVSVNIGSGYLDVVSTNEGILSISGSTASINAAGTTTVTAKMGDIVFNGGLNVTATGYVNAPTPTVPSERVVSIFSDAYTNQPGFNPAAFNNDGISVQESIVDSDNFIRYADNQFVGVGWDSPLNLSENADRKFLHFDVYVTQTIASGQNLGVEIIDYGPDGTDTGLNGGSDDTAGGTTVTGSTLKEGEWVSVDLPLTGFGAPTGGGGQGSPNLNNVARIAFIGSAGIQNMIVDNIYFYTAEVLTEPDVAAPAPPTRDAADVISLFSDAYSDVPVSTFRTPWSGSEAFPSALTDVMIMGDNAKQYTNIDFVGVETTGANLIDVTNMTHLHIDVWTAAAEFGLELVDFGADGGFDGGDDTKFKVIKSTNPREWTQIDIPLSDFTGVNRENIAQYILDVIPDGPSLWIDNFYFYNDNSGGGNPYCNTQIEHFPGVPGSEALLSITQVTRGDGFPALKFTIKADPTNGKVPDVLVLNSFEGGNGLEAADTSVPGEISQQVFWPSGAPPNDETTFQVLWSFEAEPEQWQLFETPTTRISLDVNCN